MGSCLWCYTHSTRSCLKLWIRLTTNAEANISCQPSMLLADCAEPITQHNSPRWRSASPGLKPLTQTIEQNLHVQWGEVAEPAEEQLCCSSWPLVQQGREHRSAARCNWDKPEHRLLPGIIIFRQARQRLLPELPARRAGLPGLAQGSSLPAWVGASGVGIGRGKLLEIWGPALPPQRLSDLAEQRRTSIREADKALSSA